MLGKVEGTSRPKNEIKREAFPPPPFEVPTKLHGKLATTMGGHIRENLAAAVALVIKPLQLVVQLPKHPFEEPEERVGRLWGSGDEAEKFGLENSKFFQLEELVGPPGNEKAKKFRVNTSEEQEDGMGGTDVCHHDRGVLKKYGMEVLHRA
ncbi:hypothetical protein BDK51DRAFT_25729 [Blyttiomyces helicus]|uniref:Uncharacterized protein n=1 Tax=Blyttiomyces helicus TaxID=388810 RepID=A0A4P9WEX1_9FUNG|nr:hypothetical protein BDK51DRAFT_25729 [Blyttiomyces helicus]|eukprot:RKO91279.1 hypothetical protein BDK51DRAFT_25729 [Blyttiomyces helicus]